MTDDLCFRPATELAALLRGRRDLGARTARRAPGPDRPARTRRSTRSSPSTPTARGPRPTPPTPRWPPARPVGPLHGLPVAHKDTHATGGMRTTWGSPLHADTVPLRDELVVARLKAAGAIRVGKTNVPEFAAGSHTFNPLFGATHNPYRHGLSAGGSSGGAAAALAAGFVPLAEGSDMGGSLRNPAGFCNVVGLRPTPGRVPTWPAAHGLVAAVGAGSDGPHGRRRRAAALRAGRAGPAGADLARRRPGAGFAAPLPDVAGRAAGGVGARPRRPGDRRPGDHRGAGVGRARSSRTSGRRWRRPARSWTAPTRCSARCGRGSSRPPTARSRAGTPDKVKESIRWNAEMGAKLTGADLARAEQPHTTLYERMVGVLRALRRPARADHAGAALPGRDRSTRPRSPACRRTTTWSGCAPARSSRRPAARRCRCRAASRRRPAGRAADHRGAARRPAGARGRGTPSSRPPASASAVRPSDAFYDSLAARRLEQLADRPVERRGDRPTSPGGAGGGPGGACAGPRSVRTATSSSASSCRSPAEMSASCAGRARLRGCPRPRPRPRPASPAGRCPPSAG